LQEKRDKGTHVLLLSKVAEKKEDVCFSLLKKNKENVLPLFVFLSDRRQAKAQQRVPTNLAGEPSSDKKW